MIAYQTDQAGIYIGEVECQESPLEPGVYLLPGGSTLIAPPLALDGERAVLENGVWKIESSIPVIEEPVTPEVVLTPEENLAMIQQARKEMYRDASDPVFFAWQRGEATKEEWLLSVQYVKDSNPYPDSTMQDAPSIPNFSDVSQVTNFDGSSNLPA